jgi:hypothetical protein
MENVIWNEKRQGVFMIKFSRLKSLIGIILSLLFTYIPATGNDEVQVSSGPGSVIYVGQKVTFQFAIANDNMLQGMGLEFHVKGNNGASWLRADPATVIIEGTRAYEGAGSLSFIKTRMYPDTAEDILVEDTFSFNAASIMEPHILPGGLEYTFGYSIIPQTTGQICIDSGCALGCPYISWEYIEPLGAQYSPQWSGPFCFAVVDPLIGDGNLDGLVNIADVVYLLAWMFMGGPPPNPMCLGEVNGDSNLNLGDAVYLIAHVFNGGPAPVNGSCS